MQGGRPRCADMLAWPKRGGLADARASRMSRLPDVGVRADDEPRECQGSRVPGGRRCGGLTHHPDGLTDPKARQKPGPRAQGASALGPREDGSFVRAHGSSRISRISRSPPSPPSPPSPRCPRIFANHLCAPVVTLSSHASRRDRTDRCGRSLTKRADAVAHINVTRQLAAAPRHITHW